MREVINKIFRRSSSTYSTPPPREICSYPNPAIVPYSQRQNRTPTYALCHTVNTVYNEHNTVSQNTCPPHVCKQSVPCLQVHLYSEVAIKIMHYAVRIYVADVFIAGHYL